MFSDSRIGTPDCTRVPSVRMVRATVDFSTIVPMTGIISMIRSQTYAPVLLRYNSLMKIQMKKRRQEDDVEVLDHEVAGLDQDDRHPGSGTPKSLKIASNLGMMKYRMKPTITQATMMTTIG